MWFLIWVWCEVCLIFSVWKSVDRGRGYSFGGKLIDRLLWNFWFFLCKCLLDGGCKWFCLPLCVWCCVVWVAMAICLCMERISILEVDNGGSLVLLRSGDLLGGLALMGDDLVGILLVLGLCGYNLMSILWVCTLGGDSFVGRVWR